MEKLSDVMRGPLCEWCIGSPQPLMATLLRFLPRETLRELVIRLLLFHSAKNIGSMKAYKQKHFSTVNPCKWLCTKIKPEMFRKLDLP